MGLVMVAAAALSVACAGLVCLSGAYFLILTLASLRYRKPRKGGRSPRTKFAVLVPAHNEEALLPRLLHSIARAEYPGQLLDVYVVADNCSDGTARVALEGGALPLERRDSQRRGKGYALQWLLQAVRGMGRSYDAFVFLDADCVVSAGFFAALDARFQAGSRAVQGYYTVAGPLTSPAVALRAMALALKHYVRPLGRQALGLSCGLFGTGMAFSRPVMEAHGWRAFSLAEDVEHFLRLTEDGIRVDFAPDAVVWGHMPGSLRDSRSQNLRWEKGRLQMARKHALPLLWQGLRRGDPRRVDAALEQTVPPLSLLLVLGVLAFLLAALSSAVWPLALAAAANATLWGHIVAGTAIAGAPPRMWACLAYAPWFVLWKLAIYAVALLPGRREWVKTERGS